jgi:hypothetical protein
MRLQVEAAKGTAGGSSCLGPIVTGGFDHQVIAAAAEVDSDREGYGRKSSLCWTGGETTVLLGSSELGDPLLVEVFDPMGDLVETVLNGEMPRVEADQRGVGQVP